MCRFWCVEAIRATGNQETLNSALGELKEVPGTQFGVIGIEPHPEECVPRSTGPRMDAPLSAPRTAHMSASFASSHTELTSVLGTQVGLHQSKVRGTAKASTRVGNDCVCSFWKSSEMPPSDHDSSVESVKTCPKTSESEVCRSTDLRGDPLDAMSVGGEDPLPSSSGELDQHRCPLWPNRLWPNRLAKQI